MPGLKRIVVIGATSVIAEHCCRLWLQREPADLLLVARDPVRTERIAADLRVRSPASRVAVRQVDFLDTAAIDALATETTKDGPLDTVMVAHGWLPEQSRSESDLAFCREVLEVNAVSPALFAEAFARRMEEAGIIRGFHADVDPIKLGMPITAFIRMSVVGDVFTKITVGVAAFWILLCILALNVLGRQASKFNAATLGTAAPIGTGTFKLVEFKSNEGVRLALRARPGTAR